MIHKFDRCKLLPDFTSCHPVPLSDFVFDKATTHPGCICRARSYGAQMNFIQEVLNNMLGRVVGDEPCCILEKLTFPKLFLGRPQSHDSAVTFAISTNVNWLLNSVRRRDRTSKCLGI